MSTVTKIAIGCGIAAILGGVAVAAAVFGGLWWAKGKVDGLTANETRIDDLRKKANAVPFAAPADGLIREDRLVKFLDVRKRVFAIYEKHRDELEAVQKKKHADFTDVTRGLGVVNEVRLAQIQALADVGMSEDEYRYLVQQVYKTEWASGAEALEKPRPQAAERDAASEDEGVAVPRANIALFHKYEADIKKYAMGGLEWIGL